MGTRCDRQAISIADAMQKTLEKHPDFSSKTMFISLASGNTNALSSTDKSGAPIRQNIEKENLSTLDYAKMLLVANAGEQCLLNHFGRAVSMETISAQFMEKQDVEGTAAVLQELCNELENAHNDIQQAYRLSGEKNSQELARIGEGFLSNDYPRDTSLGECLNSYDNLFIQNELNSYANFPKDNLPNMLFDEKLAGFSGQVATIEGAAQMLTNAETLTNAR